MPPVVIDVRNAEDPRDVVHRAVQALSEGKIVAFPTETVYGFGARALDPDAVARVVERIKKSKSPVMIIGSQAVLRPDVMNRLSDQLKEFGMPVFLTGMARGLLGDQCPLQFRHGRTRALKEADLVLIAGMPCDFRLNYGRSINKNAFYIAVNRSQEDLKKNRKPDMGILADPSTMV